MKSAAAPRPSILPNGHESEMEVDKQATEKRKEQAPVEPASKKQKQDKKPEPLDLEGCWLVLYHVHDDDDTIARFYLHKSEVNMALWSDEARANFKLNDKRAKDLANWTEIEEPIYELDVLRPARVVYAE